MGPLFRPSPTGPSLCLVGPSLDHLQPTFNTIALQDVVLEESGKMPETEIG